MLDDYKKCDGCHEIIRIDEYHTCISKKTDANDLLNPVVLNLPSSFSRLSLMEPASWPVISNIYGVDFKEIVEKLENDVKSKDSSISSLNSLNEQEQRKNSRLEKKQASLKKKQASLKKKQLHAYKTLKIESGIVRLVNKNLKKQLEDSIS